MGRYIPARTWSASPARNSPRPRASIRSESLGSRSRGPCRLPLESLFVGRAWDGTSPRGLGRRVPQGTRRGRAPQSDRNRWDRDHADLAAFLWNLSSSVGHGTVHPRADLVGESRKELAEAARLNRLERLPIDSRRSAVSLRLLVCDFERFELREVDVQSPKPVRRGGVRPMAYLCSKLLQTYGGLYHPAPASPLTPNASGRAPSLGGRYPASTLVRTHPPGSHLRRASRLRSRDYLASAGFLRGVRSPSLFSPMAFAHVPPPSTPPDGFPADRFRVGLLSSPHHKRLNIRDSFVTGLLLGVHSSLRPMRSLTPPGGALSVGFAGWISRAGATQAMRLRSSAASGLSPYGLMGNLQASLRCQNSAARLRPLPGHRSCSA